MSLSVHILGAGGAYPPPGYAGPSLLLEAPEARVVVDCGSSCCSRLLQAGFSPCEIDAVYVSHEHADHWAGMGELLSARGAEGCPGLRVILPGEVAERLSSRLVEALPRGREVRVEVLEPGSSVALGGGLEMAPFRVRHQVPTYGILVYEGGDGLLAYTADTAYDHRLAEALRGYRIAVVDSTLPTGHGGEGVSEMHMSVSTAWRLAVEEAGVGIAVAFHLSPPSLAEARRRRLPRLLVPGELAVINV